jgi:hemerythrin
MTIVWGEQLSVGNDILDKDHKLLIEIINQTGVHMENNDLIALKTDLQRLHEYSLEHFAREEKFAVAVGFEQASGLHQSHQMLMKRLENIRTAYMKAEKTWSPQLAQEFLEFLRNWLVDHIIREDLQMKPLLQKRSPDFAPD